jgi:hypothetical protein
MENLMQYYLTYLLERNLNTPPFFRRVRQADNPQDEAVVTENPTDES